LGAGEGTEIALAIPQVGSLHGKHGSVTPLTHKWVYLHNSNNNFSINHV
jgi:hypothetical protein